MRRPYATRQLAARPRLASDCISVLLAAGLAAGLTWAPAAAHASVDPYTTTNGFYVNPQNSAAVWSAANPGDGREPSIESAIATKPSAVWFAGQGTENIAEQTGALEGAAAWSNQLPVMVAYNITNRDICAGQSSGGASSDAAYENWINLLAVGIADRPAVVILGPDALADESCITSAEISDRDGLLNYAVAQDVACGNAVNADLSAWYGYTEPFVIDISRNGNGSNNNQWCNPQGAKLGATDQVGGGAEALLWIKDPGESDGNCGTGGGTVAGQFNPQLAYDLVYGY